VDEFSAFCDAHPDRTVVVEVVETVEVAAVVILTLLNLSENSIDLIILYW
jgi:hypothetical protein